MTSTDPLEKFDRQIRDQYGGGQIGYGFSLAAAIRSELAGTRGTHRSLEDTASGALETLHGPAPGGGFRLPNDVLRDLTTSSAGALTADVAVGGYLETLQPVSVALRLGARIEPAQAAGHTVPTGSSPVTTQWLVSESDSIGESTPGFGSAAAVPKLLGAYCEVSRQLLLQNSEQPLRRELRNAAAAALDAAILNGSGASGEPTGILQASGLGAFTGASLDQAALRNAQADVGGANAVINADACGYVGSPGVAELLATRQRFTGTDRTLWEGKSADGVVEGCRALATTGCPADTMIFGDWSNVTVVQWDGGMSIAVDPFSKFNTGLVGMRLLLPVDVIVTRPAAFSVASSIS